MTSWISFDPGEYVSVRVQPHRFQHGNYLIALSADQWSKSEDRSDEGK